MTTHLQDEDGDRERKPDPEPPRHICEFGAWFRFSRRNDGFKRHSANWASAGPDLPDLRMHRTGVDHAFPCRQSAASCLGMIDLNSAGEV